MALTPSTMLPLGTPAPDFQLLEPASGRLVRRDQFAEAPALVVVFLCNHCPYVKHLRAGLAQFGRECANRDVALVAINSNDAEAYPADSPERMVEEARLSDWTFPYLFDADQTVARLYRAACTPDFYLFDANRKLVYRGQFDDSRPGNGRPISGADLRAALEDLLAGRPISPRQLPSMGCNIKWKSGQAPEYFSRS